MQHPSIRSVLLLLGALAVFGLAPVHAVPTSVTASYNANNGKLSVNGEVNVSILIVTVTNAGDTDQVLGTDLPKANGRWSVTANNPNPVPCSIRAEQEGFTLDAVVDGAPEDCGPPVPPPGNSPPTAQPDAFATDEDTVLAGVNVLADNGSGIDDDPDGDPVSVSTFDAVSAEGATVSITVTGELTYDPTGSASLQALNDGEMLVDTFDYTITDGVLDDSATVTVTVTGITDAGEPPVLPDQTDFKIMMNYELGMHCTGFEFAYCCVLPVYNSILAQVVTPQSAASHFPRLLEADPNRNTAADVLGRHTVVRDYALDADGNFEKYVLRYWHEAQPRAGQGDPLISNVELNSLMSWNTVADTAWEDANNRFRLSGGDDPDDPDYPACTNPADASYPCNKLPLYNGARGVVLGDGDYTDTGDFPVANTPIDNYQNAVWNHLYIYSDTEGTGGVPGGDRPEANKLRLGLDVAYPTNFGPAGHGMEGLLTFTDETGTVVYTQMKVLEDLPIMLTSPRIWEALGLPLTPFEDSLQIFDNLGSLYEELIRPYVRMNAQLYHADCDGAGNCTEGEAVMVDGNPVIGFGTAPIDIPNCERCHSEFNIGGSAPNSPNADPASDPEAALVQQEINFWLAYYPDMQTGSDWYARLKGAAVSILARHDAEHGTGFLDLYPGVECSGNPDPITDPSIPCGALEVTPGNPGAGVDPLVLAQNTRAGHESVICQKCHADNVIAVVKSAYCGPGSMSCADGDLIPPLTEAIHHNHRESTERYCTAGLPGHTMCSVDADCDTSASAGDGMCEGGPITFTDSLGRSGGCQGCHPAHRSDGDMSNYPIDDTGSNTYAAADNRDAAGGCFVGRDVHSNPLKDDDGAETPSHLNPVGQWLFNNVADNGPDDDVAGDWDKGIWCTNCHSQASQQLWKAENCADLVNGDCATNVREPAGGTLTDVVNAVNASLGTGTTVQQFIDWLDPADPAKHPGIRTANQTGAIWAPDPGLCDYVVDYVSGTVGKGVKAPHDAKVAVVEVLIGDGSAGACVNGVAAVDVDCGPVNGGPQFQICGTTDTDGDFNVALVGNSEPDTDPLGGVFCTTDDCVASAQSSLGLCSLSAGDNCAVPVPFSAATDGRDHWLAAGEPHCADCHAAPYTEQSGNIDFFPPFNYPRKASLMRYSRGHQDITCQGCHESIHGLYPVTPTIDTTSYAQAASLNSDDSHGPLKCGTCHMVDGNGIPTWVDDLQYDGGPVAGDFDAAVSWMHTYREGTSPLDGVCLNCHEDRSGSISSTDTAWIEHAYVGRVSRSSMDEAELLTLGHVAGAPPEDPLTTVCTTCHMHNRVMHLTRHGCHDTWRLHLTQGRVSESVWESVSEQAIGDTCGW
jgi:VCBS repeat-containing protein